MDTLVEDEVLSYDDIEGLHELSKYLLTAVSQQFFHMLILRSRDERDIHNQLRRVDDVDFPTAMQIIGALVANGAPLTIEKHFVKPAYSTAAILRAEFEREEEAKSEFSQLKFTSFVGARFLRQALSVRGSYINWLLQNLKPHESAGHELKSCSEVLALASHLLQLMEQTLVHAIFHRHNGHKEASDTAWQISGAAMLYLTELAPHVANDLSSWQGIEVPRFSQVQSGEEFKADIDLVQKCLASARSASLLCKGSDVSALCDGIFRDCELLLLSREAEHISVQLGYSRVFSSFERAVKRISRVEM